MSQDPDHKGVGELHPIRNSQGMFLNRRMDSVMSRINARLSLLTHLPVDHQEDMQILKYEVDQHYHPHTDWFDPSTPEEMGDENGKQRWITVLHYLNSHGEDYTGGETIFPLSPEGAHQKGWTHINNCTEGRLAVRPKKGDAVMFYAMSTTFDTSMGSTHGSCDVKSGTKYSAPVWMRQTAFHPADLPPDGPVPCVDKDATHCPGWKTSGECASTAQSMCRTSSGPSHPPAGLCSCLHYGLTHSLSPPLRHGEPRIHAQVVPEELRRVHGGRGAQMRRGKSHTALPGAPTKLKLTYQNAVERDSRTNAK